MTIPHEEKIFSYLNQTEVPIDGNSTNYYGLAYQLILGGAETPNNQTDEQSQDLKEHMMNFANLA